MKDRRLLRIRKERRKTVWIRENELPHPVRGLSIYLIRGLSPPVISSIILPDGSHLAYRGDLRGLYLFPPHCQYGEGLHDGTPFGGYIWDLDEIGPGLAVGAYVEGEIVTFQISPLKLLSVIKLPQNLSRVRARGDGSFVVGAMNGEIYFFEHSTGMNLRVVR